MQFFANWGGVFGFIVAAFLFVRWRSRRGGDNSRERELHLNSNLSHIQAADFSVAQSLGDGDGASSNKKIDGALTGLAEISDPCPVCEPLAEVGYARGSDSRVSTGSDDPNIKDVAFKIRRALSAIKEGDGRFHLIVLSGVFGVDTENIDAFDFGDQLIDAVELRLRTDSSGKLRDIQSIFGPNESIRARQAILEAILGMIENSSSNSEIVFEYKNVLLSKQRSLVGRNEFGDIDYSGWLSYCSRFSLDKLRGYFPLKIYMETYASRDARRYIAETGLADIYGLYVRQTLAVIQNFSPDEEDKKVVSGEDFEKLLRSQIEGHFPNAHVELTPASGDHGADLVVNIDGVRLAIQAKYYKSNVGNAAVQEIYAGKEFYDADHAMVVCDSGFTRHAVELAEKLEVSLETTQSYLSKIEMFVGRSAVK